LRSFDRSMPEEINRVLTDAIADLLFVSEPSGQDNLRKEGIPDGRIRSVGNVMIDSVARELPAARRLQMRNRLGLTGPFALVTLHRPSNVDDLARIGPVCRFLERTAARLPVVFPVHPRTEKRLREFGLFDHLASTRGMRCLPPLGYHETLGAMSEAAVVITDSGGIQEETSFLGVPCLTMRETTERPITVEMGTNVVVGTDPLKITEAAFAALDRARSENHKVPPLWDGHTAERILAALI